MSRRIRARRAVRDTFTRLCVRPGSGEPRAYLAECWFPLREAVGARVFPAAPAVPSLRGTPEHRAPTELSFPVGSPYSVIR
ncbi:hypothetical protein ACL02S_02545 [Nocardia sp. 004]|uniref:hypothetical protein n=1 Tax=Nocardia sp. 004 TaxID=3385978 RepID=UPI0039A3BE90